MRIGLDASVALACKGERAEFVKNFVKGWTALYPLDELYLYVPKLPKRSMVASLLGAHNVSIRLPGPAGFQGRLWRLFGITNHLRADKIELFLSLDSLLPLNIKNAGIRTLLIDDATVMRTPIDRFVYTRSVPKADTVLMLKDYPTLTRLIEEISVARNE